MGTVTMDLIDKITPGSKDEGEYTEMKLSKVERELMKRDLAKNRKDARGIASRLGKIEGTSDRRRKIGKAMFYGSLLGQAASLVTLIGGLLTDQFDYSLYPTDFPEGTGSKYPFWDRLFPDIIEGKDFWIPELGEVFTDEGGIILKHGPTEAGYLTMGFTTLFTTLLVGSAAYNELTGEEKLKLDVEEYGENPTHKEVVSMYEEKKSKAIEKIKQVRT